MQMDSKDHTHNCFMALLDFVWDYPGEPPYGPADATATHYLLLQ